MQTYLVAERFRKAPGRQTRIGEGRRNWMSRSQIAFNAGDLVFHGILMLRPYRDGATTWFPRSVYREQSANPKALLPSSQAALRPPGPLRTGREGFPSPSSSPSNASLGETRFRNGKTLTVNPVMALGMK